MNPVLNLLCLFVLLVPLLWQLRRDFVKGLAYAVFLCVSVSTVLRVALPGALPQLTIFRLILLLLFFFWLKERRLGRFTSRVPFSGLFWFWAIANLVSLVFTDITFSRSLKRYLDFVLEFWGFYVIATTAIENRADAMRILRAAVMGLGVVALLAFIEKYTHFNPVNLLAPSDEEVQFSSGVTATYQHRILLGTGLAMGLPLALVFARLALTPRTKIAYWCLAILMAAGCYFAQSRGPWLGVALACSALLLLGTWQTRKGLGWILGLVLLVVILRPGVYASIVNSVKVTADANNFKGGTFRYRLELWQVAWTAIAESPLRLLFGYGLGSGLEKELEWNLSFRSKSQEITSWDNHYAYDLFQTGVVGLAAKLALYFAIGITIFRAQRQSDTSDRDVLAAVLGSILVLIFMMSNVLVFTKQLNFLFGTLAAVAFAFRLPRAELVPVEDQGPEPELQDGVTR